MIGVIASPKLRCAPSTAEVMVPYGDVDNQMLVWKVVPLMTAVIVYVVLLVSTVGVPLMVHVPLSMFRPVGREGETVQVAPVTSVMLLPITREVSNEYDVDTAVGDERSVVVPSPSCPSELSPQHVMSPLSSRAQA